MKEQINGLSIFSSYFFLLVSLLDILKWMFYSS